MRRTLSLFNVVALALLVLSALAFRAVQRPPDEPEAPVLQLAERSSVKVKVYFTDAQVQKLRSETRTVQVTQRNAAALAQAALNTWAAGPATAGNLAAVPGGSPAPKVYVRGKHYYVDLPAAYAELRYGTSGEWMLLCTLARTLLEERGDDVTFLLAGENVETLGHIDLREPHTRKDCADQ